MDMGLDIDPNTVERRDAGRFDVINGWQPAQIIEADASPTKEFAHLSLRDAPSAICSVTIEITDGPHKSRRVWKRINYKNKSAAAQQIGQQDMIELSEAMGFDRPPNDTEQLKFKPFMVRCGPDKDDREKTAAKGFKKFDPNWRAAAPELANRPAAASQPRQDAPTQQRQAPPPGNNRPWATGGAR